MCADAPDTSGMNAAAVNNANISKDALDFYKQQYADSAPDRAAASKLAIDQATTQNKLSDAQLQSSQQSQDRYNSTFVPVENKIASDAMAYDTPARRESEAAAASADAERAISGQRDASTRAMERSGALPSSGRALAMQGTIDLGAAKIKAGAANTARRNVETVGAAKLADAAGVGRGVFTNNTTQAQIGLNAGNSSVANGQVPLAVTQSGAQLMGQGFQTGIQGNTSAGNMYGNIAGIQNGTSAANGQSAAAAGTAVAGIAIAI